MKLRCLNCKTINVSDNSNISCSDCGHDFRQGGWMEVKGSDIKSEKLVRGKTNPTTHYEEKSFGKGHLIFSIIHISCIFFIGIPFLILTIPLHLIFWGIVNKK